MSFTTDHKKAIVIFGGSVFLFLLLKTLFAPSTKISSKTITSTPQTTKDAKVALAAYKDAKNQNESADSLKTLNDMIFSEYGLRVRFSGGSYLVVNSNGDTVYKG